MGMRILSNLLKSKGHEVNLVFFNVTTEKIDTKLLKQLLELCRDSDIIGMSVMTMQYTKSVHITDFLRKNLKDKLFVWGGIHPTLCPNECVAHADIICVGDGEDFFLELLDNLQKKKDYKHIEGSWAKDGKNIIKNSIRQIHDNIDDFPPPDFDYRNKWVIVNNALVPMTLDMQKEFFKTNFLVLKGGAESYCYVTQATRGCPHRCTYCSNAMFLDIFKGKGKILRRKSVSAIMKELRQVRKQYPFINAVNFYDDTFFATTDEEIIKFSKAYKKNINLPFFCLASPSTLNEVKLRALLKAGMGHIQLGVQSGSERLNREVYKRFVSNKVTLEKMRMLNKYKNKIVPSYDFIVDNPYETVDDQIEVIKFMYQMPRPYKIQLFSLVFYPHTELYERAMADGILKKSMTGYKKSLSKLANRGTMNFYSFAILYSPLIPRPVYKLFTYKPVFKLLNSKFFDNFFEYGTRFTIYINNKIHLNRNIINR